MMIRVTICQGLAPRLRATLNQAGSTLARPEAVANATGQTDAIAIRKMIACSQPANTTTAIGSQDSGLIMRRNWNGTLVSRWNHRMRPMRMPSGMPMAIARPSPAPSR